MSSFQTINQTADFLRLLDNQWQSQVSHIKNLELQHTKCFRLLNETSAGLDLEVFGTLDGWCLFAYLKKPQQLHFDWAQVAQHFSTLSGTSVALIGGALKEESSSRSLPLLWSRPGISSEQSSVQWTQESGLQFRLEFENVLNPGLFMDQRENRQELSHKLKKQPGPVLNLFSYTGAFSLTATAHGLESTSVDVSKRYLSWERENQEKNGTLHLSKRVPEDSRKFLTRAARRISNKEMEPFRWIVVDPPTFSRSAGVIFRVEQDMPALIDACVRVLSPNGGILVSSNDGGWPTAEFEKTVRSQASRLKFSYEPGTTAQDFRNKNYPLKSAWLLRNL